MDKTDQFRYQQSYLNNEYGKFWIEDGILMEFFHPEVKNITFEIAYTMVKDRLIISNGVTMPLLVDLNNATSIDMQAREFFSEEDSLKFISASAFLIHNYIHWLGGKLFLSINRPKANIELFRTKGRALHWLKNYRSPASNE